METLPGYSLELTFYSQFAAHLAAINTFAFDLQQREQGRSEAFTMFCVLFGFSLVMIYLETSLKVVNKEKWTAEDYESLSLFVSSLLYFPTLLR